MNNDFKLFSIQFFIEFSTITLSINNASNNNKIAFALHLNHFIRALLKKLDLNQIKMKKFIQMCYTRFNQKIKILENVKIHFNSETDSCEKSTDWLRLSIQVFFFLLSSKQIGVQLVYLGQTIDWYNSLELIDI